MSCRDAMTDKFITVSPDDDVEAALKSFKRVKIDVAPVVDGEGRIIGLFSLQSLMKNLLPVSVPMAGGIQLDIRVAAAPGIGKRLKKMRTLRVADVMERKVFAVDPDTSLWEGVNHIVTHGSPMMVVEGGSGRVIGMMTYQSALDALEQAKDNE